MKFLSIVFLLTSMILVAQETSLNNHEGIWTSNSTWLDGSSPGNSNIPSFVINGDVTSESSLNMADQASLSIEINDTLIVDGNISFPANKNFASVTVRSGGILIIFGNLAMGKNNAGVTVEAGGVLVVQGDVTDTGGGGNTINATGDVYVGGSSTDVGGSGTVKTIDELSDDGFSEVEEFVGGGGSSPLPVELHYFEVHNDHNIVLRWETITELNNDYFSVERSEDGFNFYEIGTVKGSGNSNQSIEYSFNDKAPISRIEYYRLRQVDFDGKSEAFETVRVETNLKSKESVYSIYPSIVRNRSISIASDQPFQVQSIILYDLGGGRHFELTQHAKQENPMVYSIHLTDFSSGVYLLKSTTSLGEEITSRVVIK